MWIIVGLGNPTLQYEGTRHNVGFDVIDMLSAKYDISVDTRKFRAYIGKGRIAGQSVILCKPQTYMNVSGESVEKVLSYYNVEPEDEFIVIVDDVSLPVGQVRIRKQGSNGGHNGLKSLIKHLATNAFTRIRIGVGEKPPKYDLADYVLGHFTKQEREVMEEGYQRATEAIELMIRENIDTAMNLYNKKLVKEEVQ